MFRSMRCEMHRKPGEELPVCAAPLLISKESSPMRLKSSARGVVVQPHC